MQSLSCETFAAVSLPPSLKIGTFGEFSLVSIHATNFKRQLEDPANYGPTGTFKLPTNLFVEQANIDNLTAEALAQTYKVLWISVESANSSSAVQKIKEYMNLGGVAVFVFDYLPPNQQYKQNLLYTSFGYQGTTPRVYANETIGRHYPAGVTSGAPNMSGPFGDATVFTPLDRPVYTNVGLNSVLEQVFAPGQTYQLYLNNLANFNINRAYVWSLTNQFVGKNMWLADSNIYFNLGGGEADLFRGYIPATINNSNAIFMNNLMAEILRKAGFTGQ